MHPLSDKDLDRLSREAAEQYDVEQNTSGWDKLEQKLNKHLPEKGKKERRRFLFFIWIFALLSGGGLLWMLTGSPSSRMITLKEGSSEISLPKSADNATDRASSTPDTKNEGDIPNTKSKDGPLLDDNRELIQNEKTIAEKTTSEKIDTDERNTIVAGKRTNPKSPTAKTMTAAANKKNSPIDEKSSEENTVAGLKKKNNNLSEPAPATASADLSPIVRSDKNDSKNPNASSNNKSQKDIPTLAENQPRANENGPGADSAKQTVTAVTKSGTDSNSLVKKAADLKKAPGFQKGLQIGLVAAPDMSNVKFTNTDKVGYNVGVHLGYRLSNKWSVNTGVIYTMKNYTSQGKDFNPPKGSWIDNVKLDMVEGNCIMFDIPLNVRYDLNDGKSHRYFLNTGLSTYLMKKEDYHYHYQYSNGSPGYRYRSSSSSEQHWLSVVNISAGFEKKLSNRFSIQAEPYLKIPLSGVGYGNLQLNSYGVYFLLKFNTNKR
jgi:hypothetical protein